MMELETLLFEPERSWTERALVRMGLSVISCILVPEKAREICARYRDQAGNVREIVVQCVPDMTEESVVEAVRSAVSVA